MFWRSAAIVAFAAAVPLQSMSAQSAYVPLNDVAYVYIDALIARNQLRSLSLLERPYTVDAVRAALRGNSEARGRRSGRRSDPGSRRRATMHFRLEAAIAKYDLPPARQSSFRAAAHASLWATATTSAQRDLMLADEISPPVRPGGALTVIGGVGPIIGVSRTMFDNSLNDDPDFAGRKDRRIAGRTEDAYVAGQWRYGELFFGRAARNWGPHAHHGLLVSNAPYTYDHLYGRIGSTRLNMALLFGRLNDHSSPLGDRVQRYVATHRLAARFGGFEAALAESFLYTGVGRGIEPSLLNPLAVYGLAFRNEQQDGNLLLSAQVASRTRLGNLSAELLVDDVQIDRCDPLCAEPSSYGFTLSATGIPAPLSARLFTSYTRVTALTYRTPNPAERYASFDVGLGRSASDYDEARIGVDLVPGPFAVQLYAAFRRQGEGDYRARFPDPSEYVSQPVIFEGSVLRVRRAAVSGGGRWADLEVRGDVGYNWVENPPGILRQATGFAGRVRLAWAPRRARVILDR